MRFDDDSVYLEGKARIALCPFAFNIKYIMATYPHTAKITVFVARLSARFPGNLPSLMR